MSTPTTGVNLLTTIYNISLRRSRHLNSTTVLKAQLWQK